MLLQILAISFLSKLKSKLRYKKRTYLVFLKLNENCLYNLNKNFRQNLFKSIFIPYTITVIHTK